MGIEIDAGEIGTWVRLVRRQLTRFLRPANIIKNRNYKCLFECEAAKELEHLVGEDGTHETVIEIFNENPKKFKTGEHLEGR